MPIPPLLDTKKEPTASADLFVVSFLPFRSRTLVMMIAFFVRPLMFAHSVLSSTMRMTVAWVFFNSSGTTGVETERKTSRHHDGRYTLEPSPSIFAAISPAIVLANCPSHLAFSRLLRYAAASWSDIFQHRRRLYFHHLAYFAPLDPSNRMALPMLALPPSSPSSLGPELVEASRKRLQPTCW